MQFSVRVEAFDSNLIQVGCPHSVSQKAQIPCRKSEWLITYLYSTKATKKKTTPLFLHLRVADMGSLGTNSMLLGFLQKALSLQKWWFLRDRLLQWDPHWSPSCFFLVGLRGRHIESCRWSGIQTRTRITRSYHEVCQLAFRELPRNDVGQKTSAFGNDEYEGHHRASCTVTLEEKWKSWDISRCGLRSGFKDVAPLPKKPMVFNERGVTFRCTQRHSLLPEEKAQKKFIEISHAYEASLYRFWCEKRLVSVSASHWGFHELTYCGFAMLVRDPCWN